jgi:hypothetical protein
MASLTPLRDEPDEVEAEYKFLLSCPPSSGQLGAFGEPSDLEQFYLVRNNPLASRRVRSAERHGVYTYYYTEKRNGEDLIGYGGAHVRHEGEHEITSRIFRELLCEQDDTKSCVVKRRWSLKIADGVSVDLDHVVSPVDVWLVELEVSGPTDPSAVLGGLVDLGEDVTGNPLYDMESVAGGSLIGRH